MTRYALVSGLEIELIANNGQFVVLQFLKGLLLVDVRDHARGVDHARAEEKFVKVISSCKAYQRPRRWWRGSDARS